MLKYKAEKWVIYSKTITFRYFGYTRSIKGLDLGHAYLLCKQLHRHGIQTRHPIRVKDVEVL